MKILVIDDDEMILNLTKRILNKAGFEVLLAKSGRKGIDVFLANHTDIPIIVVDMNMQGMNGIETISHIWSKKKDVQFVISSGNLINPDEISENIRNNVKLLQKPYRSAQFAQLISDMLQTA